MSLILLCNPGKTPALLWGCGDWRGTESLTRCKGLVRVFPCEINGLTLLHKLRAIPASCARARARAHVRGECCKTCKSVGDLYHKYLMLLRDMRLTHFLTWVLHSYILEKAGEIGAGRNSGAVRARRLSCWPADRWQIWPSEWVGGGKQYQWVSDAPRAQSQTGRSQNQGQAIDIADGLASAAPDYGSGGACTWPGSKDPQGGVPKPRSPKRGGWFARKIRPGQDPVGLAEKIQPADIGPGCG